MCKRKRWMIPTVLTGSFLASALLAAVAQSEPSRLSNSVIRVVQEGGVPTSLQLKKPIENKLAGVEQHEYQIAIEQGQFIYIVVEQKGVDVVVRLYAPDRTRVVEVDSPNGTQGSEPLLTIAEVTGQYRVEVAKLEKDAPPGNYEIRLEELRGATTKDHQLIARLADLARAVQLGNEANDLESKRKYSEAELLLKSALAIREKTLGPDHALVAHSLNNLAELYKAKGDYAQAELYFKRTLIVVEQALGPEKPEFAAALNNLASLYDDQGDFAQAEPLFKRALAILERVYGPDHAAVASLLNNLAASYEAKGNYEQAEPLFTRALAIREKVFGAEDFNIVTSLNNLAVLYHSKGDYGRAEPLLKRALVIRERMLGTEHPDLATSLNNLGVLYEDNGDYEQAEAVYKRALAIREKALGPEHFDFATSLNNLADLYYDKGDYAQAGPLYKRSLMIFEKSRGPEHSSVATSLNNLAELYKAEGDYAQAEPLFKRALTIREKVLGPEHPDVARSLDSLGEFYRDKGDYAQSELSLQRALTIREKILGPEHPDVARSLNNLAGLYYSRDDYPRAELLFKRALAIRKKVLGPTHPDSAVSLNNLAELYRVVGDLAHAETLYKDSLVVFENILGSEHPFVATSLNNLAVLYRATGNYTQAETLFKRALAIRKKTLGSEHVLVAASLNNFAVLYQAKGDYKAAVQFLERGSEVEEHNLRLILTTGSERQKQLYLNTIANTLHAAVSIHVRLAPQDGSAARLALTEILRRKGRVLDAMTDQIGVLRRHATVQSRKLLDLLAATRSRLARLQISAGRQLTAAVPQTEVTRLTGEVESLENEVSLRSGEFRVQVAPITFESVRQAIPVGAALVEICTYEPFNVKAKSEADRFGAPRYVVYVARHDDAVPQWVDLGEAAVIDTEVQRFRAALKDPQRTDVRIFARTLDERVMLPIRRLLGTTKHIFVSPDGMLNLVPFAALIDEHGKYLVENYSIDYLTSGRDLLRLQAQTENRSAPVVIADPRFDLSAMNRPTATGGQESQDDRGANLRSSDFTLKTYAPLQGTAQEAAALARVLPHGTQILLQEQATEATLKQVKGPLLLHIATHGFFLPDRSRTVPDGTGQPTGTSDVFDTPVLLALRENPLLRSGLVLAGVNQGRSGAGEDGVLTAFEVAGLDLWGTRLVVLSACQTGLGEVKNGAGVYGLRRALVLAGSETQVMSLWKVSDAGARDLMIAYYTRLQKGEGRAEALRQVQLTMLHGQLKARVSSGKRGTTDTGGKVVMKDFRHPYYWAAFIQSGDWRSLERK